MLPKWHILYGAIFALALYISAPNISLLNLSLVFLASFLIDFDHYMAGAMRNRSISLRKSIDYNYSLMHKQMAEQKKGIRKQGDFHLFHTLEFHILIAVLGIFYEPFFYIFIGMAFHSLLDLYDLSKRDVLYVREYFFFRWLAKKFV